jgi:hypothetical protein
MSNVSATAIVRWVGVCVCVCVYLAQAKEYSIEQLVILAQVEQVDPKVQGSLVDLLSFGIAEQHPTVKVMALQ